MTVTQERHEKTFDAGLPRLSEVELVALDLVRKQGPLSRTALANYLGLSRGSVTAIVGNLVDLEVLTEVGFGDSEGGRLPIISGMSMNSITR
ncbi:MAG: hypothetical protein ACERKX_12580 [Anaerolineales bacterium]